MKLNEYWLHILFVNKLQIRSVLLPFHWNRATYVTHNSNEPRLLLALATCLLFFHLSALCLPVPGVAAVSPALLLPCPTRTAPFSADSCCLPHHTLKLTTTTAAAESFKEHPVSWPQLSTRLVLTAVMWRVAPHRKWRRQFYLFTFWK